MHISLSMDSQIGTPRLAHADPDGSWAHCGYLRSGPAAGYVLQIPPRNRKMTDLAFAIKHEVHQLVDRQIEALRQPSGLTASDLSNYRERSQKIRRYTASWTGCEEPTSRGHCAEHLESSPCAVLRGSSGRLRRQIALDGRLFDSHKSGPTEFLQGASHKCLHFFGLLRRQYCVIAGLTNLPVSHPFAPIARTNL